MKKNRILSSLLCLSLAAGLLIPGLPAYAEGEGESGSNSGMKLSKTATANDDGTYTITLEAYATGQKVISSVNKDVPTDIVLVLDQSGSMADPIGTVSFSEYSRNQSQNYRHYDRRHNGGSANLWHKLDDDSYAPVSVTVEQKITYIAQSENDNDYYYNNKNNLYVYVNGEYLLVTVTRTGKYWDGNSYARDYEYKLPDGTVIATGRGDNPPTFTDSIENKVFYLQSINTNESVYTYTYVDAGGNIIEIGTSTGAETVYNPPFYQRNINQNAGGSRIAALKSAVTAFTNSVATKAAGEDGILGNEDDIDHRIAVVGFASGDPSDTLYLNSEVFVGAGQYQYNTTASAHYGEALQSMKTEIGQNNIKASINALAANGATYTNLGVEMANGILQANPVPSGQKRNRVVIVFTDGVPGRTGYSSIVAESAITQANTSRSLGANVYAVGIFSGADASSAGNSIGTETQKANWFMQNLSDNKGNPRTPSYYLSAADAGTLNSIFQQIADNIETGGSSTTLDESAVIKDIISPAFTLPEGTEARDITLETYKCTGKNGDVYIWEENNTAMGATPAVNGDQVSVTGFDFAENYVGTVTENGNTTYRGNKLVISFTVSPKAGFLGGNNVYTNTSAGVYENKDATNPVLEFNRPQVNVPIKDVPVTAADKDVYLLSDVELDALKNGATVMVGKVPLNLTANNYGLESWQNEYVDITVEIKDKDGNVISTDLSDLTDDTTYTVAVTVTPEPAGTNSKGKPATAQDGSRTAKINVYKPELTYKDSEVFYGDVVPADTELAANLTAINWKHGDTVADTAKMGAAPTLTVTYSPDDTKIADGKINSKDDIKVDATVEIESTDVTDNTTFLHSACDPACGWNTPTQGGSPAFLLHVKTATLTITKTGADGNKNEGFIFKVEGPENFRVSVKDNGTVKITGLPLGEYTVTEETGWSWRYKAAGPAQAELTKNAPDGAVTIKNEKSNPYLLDGNAYVQNISRPAAGN